MALDRALSVGKVKLATGYRQQRQLDLNSLGLCHRCGIGGHSDFAGLITTRKFVDVSGVCWLVYIDL